jgi:polyhydroxyalkanoate synthesis regulator phasin
MGMYNSKNLDKNLPTPNRNKTPDLNRQVRQLRENLEFLTRKLDETIQKVSRLTHRVQQLENQIANIKKL